MSPKDRPRQHVQDRSPRTSGADTPKRSPRVNYSASRARSRLSERTIAPVRALSTGVVALWVLLYLRSDDPQLASQAQRVAPLAFGAMLASIGWAVAVFRSDYADSRKADAYLLAGGFAVTWGELYLAYELMLAVIVFLPILSLSVAARFGLWWLVGAIVGSIVIVLSSVPFSYWPDNPAIALLVTLLVVGLPITINSLIDQLRVDSLEAKDLGKKRALLLSVLAHELRQPITSIVSGLDLLDTSRLNRDGRDLIDQVRKGANSLVNRLGTANDLATLETGRLQLNHAPFDLGTLLRTVHALHASDARSRAILLTVTQSTESECCVVGDKTRIEQVLGNLVGNAIRYTPPGGKVELALEAGPKSDEVCLRSVFSVTDNGPGIPDDMKQLIFGAYVQIGKDEIQSSQGQGLGLYICGRLASAMNGDLRIDDAPTGGSIFRFMVDLPKHADGLNEPLDPLVALQKHKQRYRPLRCLVFDDNLSNAAVLGRLLGHAGHDVQSRADGASAQSDVRSYNPDIIFLDLHMPGISGFSVLEKIRSTPDTAKIPVVVFSGDISSEAGRRVMELGSSAFLSKPIVAGRLLDIIERLAATPRSQ